MAQILLVITAFCTVFSPSPDARRRGWYEFTVPSLYDSNSSCHLLSYGCGVGVWGETLADTPDTAGPNEE